MILLAAGNSRRFGGNKLLADFRGKPLYRYTLDMVLAARGELQNNQVDSNIIIVSQYGEILHHGAELGLVTVQNKEPELGISHSVKLGLEELQVSIEENDGEKYMFFVCDQPFLKAKSVIKLILEYLESGKSMGCLSFKGKLGNPCIFDGTRLEELMLAEGDRGGKKIILKHRSDTLTVELEDERELFDIDYDLGMFLKY